MVRDVNQKIHTVRINGYRSIKLQLVKFFDLEGSDLFYRLNPIKETDTAIAIGLRELSVITIK